MSVELRSQCNTGKDNANFIFSERMPHTMDSTHGFWSHGVSDGVSDVHYSVSLANPASGRQMSNTMPFGTKHTPPMQSRGAPWDIYICRPTLRGSWLKMVLAQNMSLVPWTQQTKHQICSNGLDEILAVMKNLCFIPPQKPPMQRSAPSPRLCTVWPHTSRKLNPFHHVPANDEAVIFRAFDGCPTCQLNNKNPLSKPRWGTHRKMYFSKRSRVLNSCHTWATAFWTVRFTILAY